MATAPVTSGIVSGSPFTIRQIIDHASRRAGKRPERVEAEYLDVAVELLSLLTSEWINAGFPLWTRQWFMLGPTVGSPEATCPVGTAEILRAFWRILQPWRGAATLTDGSSGNILFAGAPNADVVVPGPNPSVTVNFGQATETDTVGVLLGGSSSITAALSLLTSTDGVTFTPLQTLPSATYAPGVWTYFDLDPSVMQQYLRIQYGIAGSWTLNQLNFALANGTDVEIGPLNIDDYYRLPNKFFQSNQCLSAYQDRQLNNAVLKLWPVPNQNAFYNAAIVILGRRYIQDPGALTNALEVPQRWNEAAISRLAQRFMDELPDDDDGQQPTLITMQMRAQRYERVSKQADKAELLAWAEERARGPIRLGPDISCYTR